MSNWESNFEYIDTWVCPWLVIYIGINLVDVEETCVTRPLKI